MAVFTMVSDLVPRIIIAIAGLLIFGAHNTAIADPAWKDCV
jgi:hypothetical protein